LGFAAVGDDEAVFTDGDVEALRTWDALVASGTMAREDELAHARVMGQTLSRLAEWQAREGMARADGQAPGTRAGGRRAGGAARGPAASLRAVRRLRPRVGRRPRGGGVAGVRRAPPGALPGGPWRGGSADLGGHGGGASPPNTGAGAPRGEPLGEDP